MDRPSATGTPLSSRATSRVSSRAPSRPDSPEEAAAGPRQAPTRLQRALESASGGRENTEARALQTAAEQFSLLVCLQYLGGLALLAILAVAMLLELTARACAFFRLAARLTRQCRTLA